MHCGGGAGGGRGGSEMNLGEGSYEFLTFTTMYKRLFLSIMWQK